MNWLIEQPGSKQLFSPEQITETAIRGYLEQLTINGRKPRTRNQALTALRRFCRWAIGEGYMTRNPANEIRRPTIVNVAPRELTPEQRYVLKNRVEIEQSPRLSAIFALGYWAGLRVSEVSQLQVKDCHVNQRSGQIMIRDSKSGKTRTIDLHGEAHRALYDYLQKPNIMRRDVRDPDSIYVFTSQRAGWLRQQGRPDYLTTRGITYIWTTLKQKAPRHEYTIIYDTTFHDLRQAIAMLDNFVLHHPFSWHWGRGTTSSSDGMRVPVTVNAPNAVYNARHFWYRRGITIVAHASDIWMPFYPQVMEDTSEALYVIDALCHHETDFDIQEHYTDTASATYHVFALCRMLGFRFAPRIRGITKKYLYSVEPLTTSKALKPLLKGTADTDLIVQNWDNMRRLPASIRHGTVSASLMMRKLASYPKQNQLAQAFNEMGKL